MNDQTPLPAPGWYADPASPETALRYWDGADWTEHVHPLQPQAADEAARQEAGTAQEPSVAAESAAPEQAPAEALRVETAAGAERATEAGPAEPVAESAPSEPAPDVAVPSAEGVTPSPFDAPEASEEPVTDPAAAQDGDAPSQATPSPELSAEEEPAAARTVPEPAAPAAAPQTDRPNPYAAQQSNPAEQQERYGQQQNLYGQQSPANPYAPTAAAPQPGRSAPQPPTAPWAQGAANPYQQPQPAQYGAQPGAPKSNKGLWIGLGIGGGVFLLLVIGIIIAIAAFFANIGNTIRDFDPPVAPSFGAEEPPGTEAPEIEGEVYAMGEAFVLEHPVEGLGSDWQITVSDFSADAAEAAGAAPGDKALAVLVQATNVGDTPADPWVDFDVAFVGSDDVEYEDTGIIQPGLYDVDTIAPGATTSFTLTFEIPEGLDDSGSVLFYDFFVESYAAVEVG